MEEIQHEINGTYDASQIQEQGKRQVFGIRTAFVPDAYESPIQAPRETESTQAGGPADRNEHPISLGIGHIHFVLNHQNAIELVRHIQALVARGEDILLKALIMK